MRSVLASLLLRCVLWLGEVPASWSLSEYAPSWFPVADRRGLVRKEIFYMTFFQQHGFLSSTHLHAFASGQPYSSILVR
jgi:hypothetical protein